MSSMWSNERVIEFMELYQSEPVIWNPMDRKHKNKNLITDAWKRIQTSFSISCTVSELKRKKESLMSTYRLYKKKINDSIRSGASTDDIYKCNWFAFDLMDSFLGPVYNKENDMTINTATCIFSDENYTNPRCLINENSYNSGDNSENSSTPELAKRPRYNCELARSDREVDEVDLFCQLLAKKIKKFDSQQRDDIMHEIDILIYNKRHMKT